MPVSRTSLQLHRLAWRGKRLRALRDNLQRAGLRLLAQAEGVDREAERAGDVRRLGRRGRAVVPAIRDEQHPALNGARGGASAIDGLRYGVSQVRMASSRLGHLPERLRRSGQGAVIEAIDPQVVLPAQPIEQAGVLQHAFADGVPASPPACRIAVLPGVWGIHAAGSVEEEDERGFAAPCRRRRADYGIEQNQRQQPHHQPPQSDQATMPGPTAQLPARVQPDGRAGSSQGQRGRLQQQKRRLKKPAHLVFPDQVSPSSGLPLDIFSAKSCVSNKGRQVREFRYNDGAKFGKAESVWIRRA